MFDEAAIWKVWGPLLTIAVIFFIRFRRAGTERPLRLWSLWFVPLLVLALLGAALVQLRPPPLGLAALLLGAVLGVALGWHRGKLIGLRRDSGGRIHQQVSPAAILLLLGIVALRFLLQQHYGAGEPGRPAPLAATMIGDGLLGLAAATIIATRIELALRVRALLAGKALP